MKAATEKAAVASGSSFDKLASFGQKAFLGVAAAAVSFGAVAVKAALEGEVAHANLAQAVKNAGDNFAQAEPKINRLTEGLAKFGFTNDEAEAALARLVQITGNTTQSMDLLGIATNLAAARHLDLTAAAQLVGRAAEGQITPLKRMGITVQDTGSAAGNAEAALKLLNERFGGAAQAQADTYAGKLKAFRAETENLTEKVGNALLPILADAAGVLASTVGFFERNEAAAVALGIAVGGPLTVAIGAYLIKETVLIATKLADFFETAAIAALYAKDALIAAGSAVYTALGPVGLAIAAVSALAIAFDSSGDSSRKAADSYAEAYIASAKQSSDATGTLKLRIGELRAEQEQLIEAEARKISADAANDEGVRNIARSHLEASNQYVHNRQVLNDLTKEVKNAETANKAHKEATADATVAQDKQGSSADDLAQKLGLTTDQVDVLAKKLGVDLTKNADDAETKISALASRLAETNPTTLKLRDAFKVLTDQTADATEKANAFKTALDLLIGGNIDAEKAAIAFQDSLQTLGEKLKDDGKSLDINTGAGRENVKAIEATVEAARNHIEALQKQGASSGELNDALAKQVDGLKNTLTYYGYSKDQIDQLIQKYGLVPGNINTVITADVDQAVNSLKQIASQIVPIINAGAGGSKGVVRVFDEGGWVPGSGPQLAVVHGGEFVLSHKMLGNPSTSVGPGAVVVNLSVGPGTDRATADYAAQVAREQVTLALEGILDRRNALSPAGAAS